jgi:hypothetical protein
MRNDHSIQETNKKESVGMSEIIFILFLHWIGDFILQSDWMAKNKSKSNKALLIHTSVYCLPLFIFGWKFALINMILHTITDYFSSRVSSKLYAKNEIHWFFVVVGLDQFIHTACLILTLGSLR